MGHDRLHTAQSIELLPAGLLPACHCTLCAHWPLPCPDWQLPIGCCSLTTRVVLHLLESSGVLFRSGTHAALMAYLKCS